MNRNSQRKFHLNCNRVFLPVPTKRMLELKRRRLEAEIKPNYLILCILFQRDIFMKSNIINRISSPVYRQLKVEVNIS